MKKLVAALISILTVFACASFAFAADVADDEKTVQGFQQDVASNGFTYQYYEPKNGNRCPLIIYIHGIGYGNKDDSLTQEGLTYLASEQVQKKFEEGGAFILMPVIPNNSRTTDLHEKLFEVVKEFVEKFEMRIDGKKIQVLGVSNGGSVAIKMMAAHPKLAYRGAILNGFRVMTPAEAKALEKTQVLMISAKREPYTWFGIFACSNWNNLKAHSNIACTNTKHIVFTGKVNKYAI